MNSTIPDFPEGVSLTDIERNTYEAALPAGEESSDFQWLSLRAWNPTARVSMLMDALVIEFADYHDPRRRFHSFSGGEDADGIAQRLLEHAIAAGEPALHLVPESTAARLSHQRFRLTEDRDNHDYVYSTQATHHAVGASFRRVRRVRGTLERRYSGRLKTASVPLNDANTQDLLALTNVWAHGKERSREAVDEVDAVKRCISCLQDDPANGVLVTGLFLGSDLIAYSIDEVLSPSLALGHFGHASRSVPDAGTYLHHEVARILLESGVDWLNDEQDLGDAGLRRHKSLNRPHRFVRKYSVAFNQLII